MTSYPKRLQRRLLTLLSAIVPATAYVVIAVQRLRFPGLHFDELLHVNAALGGLDTTFVYKSIAGIPVLLMPYIGALKSYLAAPIFELFGVSVLTIRLPMIVVTALALVLLGATLRRWVGPWPALVCCSLLALDPSLINLTRADSGPVALQFALSVVALAFIERYLRTRALDAALGVWLVLGLLVFNKLNGVWIVTAIALALLIVYGRTLWAATRGSNRVLHVIVHGLGYASILAYYLVASYKFSLFTFLQPGKFDVSARIANFASSLRGMASGELYYNYAYGHLEGSIVVVVGVVAALVIGLVMALRTQHRNRRAYLLFALISVLIAAQIFVTRNAVWPWHFATLYPFISIALVVGLHARHPAARSLARSAGLVFIIYLLIVNVTYIQKHGEPTKNVYWSPAIYDLISYTQVQDRRVVSIDWGTHTQLLALSQDPDKYKNPSFTLNRDPLPTDARRAFIQEYASPDDLFVLHTEQHTLFLSSRKNFFELSDSAGFTPRLQTVIASGLTPLFELYTLEPVQPSSDT